MKITIKADPKEIAALVVAIQEQQGLPEIPLVADWAETTLKEHPDLFNPAGRKNSDVAPQSFE